MAHKKSGFIEALDRSEASRDGGFKQSWSFSLSADHEEERRNDPSLVTMDQVGGGQELSSDGVKQAPPLRHFDLMEPMKTYERRPNHYKSLNRTGSGKPSEAPHAMAISPLPNRTNYIIMSPAPSQGVVVQGRLFQHTHLPSPVRKPVQSNLDLKERSNFNTQTAELDKIILTCSEISDSETLNVKRCVQPKRRPMFESIGTAESLQPDEYFTVCGKCGQQSEDHTKCESCGNPLPADISLLPAVPSSPAPRVPVRSLPSPGSPSITQLSKTFYGVTSGGRTTHAETAMNPPARINRGGLLLPHNGAKLTMGKRQPLAKQHELNDPIVLSSDEDDEADSSSTGSVNRLDSVSPRPADSAHSSPAPSSGRVEAAVKEVAEHEEHVCEFFNDVDHRSMVPRRNRLKEPFRNALCEDPSPSKKRKLGQMPKLESIILECRSVRIGTLRRMVTKPVIFTVEYIQLETEGQKIDMLEKVRLRSSELTSCEWCSVRKLPVLFFQTSDSECQRLRTQLQMSQESGGLWYDCSGETTVTTATAGTATATPAASTETTVQSRFSTPLHGIYDDDDEEEDMAELQPTFTGPIIKLIVYPPPPAKGGISVTNEDLHCLNNGEFLNDVIIDFYLKYLFMEKLKKEDAGRSHVFSSFFYKRLNQRERRSAPDTTNLPIQKRKHNRVKTWTRHVDLFQKDFIFVPINESAHWYLAVICFPGLKRPCIEPNPLYQPQTQSQAQASSPSELGSSVLSEGGIEEPSPHTEPLSFNPEEVNTEAEGQDISHSSMPSCPHRPPEHSCEHSCALNQRVNGQVQSHYTDALQRISVCYSSEDPGSFSDDQSSSHDECSEDGALADDTAASESMEWASRPTNCKQPCILIMDSLRGPARSTVVKTLREYLEVEWEVRKGSQRSFGKDVMKGSSPRVPQQDNFSDCGVYVLQYVESFFENPVPSFHLPMNLLDWFPQQRMKTKREEIKELILKIQSQQQLDRENSGQDLDVGEACEDLDIGDALESADLIPPISS
ncbi:sentrin-specific protease 6 isoform X5 [Neoarius graeffei]|uniref:sentrin-specific protease 6 isoform X5 n=1 Tax=Neoarius graeffei TaxID=443677 RepID=UPI00298D4D7A|nr:sentrin-specific protease 6 isoform X5 [Neoarius graeffei]